jgi:predicted secreted protein
VGVAFVAHCLLNQNSKVAAGAHCAGVYSPVVEVLRSKGWRIEQMPCPELAFTGLNRFWAVREQLDTLAFRRHCQRLAGVVVDMIGVYAERGEDVALIGVDGSPSMGVHITSSDPSLGGVPDWPEGSAEQVDGEGIFVAELRRELSARGITARAWGERYDVPGQDERADLDRLAATLDQDSAR